MTAAACSVREEAREPQEHAVRKKILFKGAPEVEQSSFLIKFDRVPTESIVSEIMERRGILAIEPLFTRMPGKEDLEARFGLDRWYQVTLDSGADLDNTVLECAEISSVSVVQYNLAYSLSEVEKETRPTEEDFFTKGTLLFNKFTDPMFGDQWHYINTGNQQYGTGTVAGADINVKDVWTRLTCGDPDIIIAVVDEGVKYNHPDLQGNMWVNPGEIPGDGVDNDGNGYIDDVYGYNFVTNGPVSWGIVNSEGKGDSGHGTHCAGTIAAVSNNSKGVVGIAGGTGKKDGCRIMSCQIFSGTSGGSTSVGARAIKYAADMGASIISCSFGYSHAFASDNAYLRSQGFAEIDAIHYFEASKNNPVLDGNIAIFAAGNESQGFAHYPGAFVDIISVSAFGPDFLPAYYSNYGPGCNISAPGGNMKLNYAKGGVLSTLTSEISRSDYGYMQGTSMACPHVSGVVALGLSYAKQLGKKFTVSEFKQMILASTNDIDQRIANTTLDGYAKYYHQMGTGAIDAWRLMMHIEGTPTSTAQVGRKQWISLESLLGTSSVSLSYLDVEVPQETIDALGLQKISGSNDAKYPATPSGECYAYVQFGRLYVHPTKMGSGKFIVKVVGGGDHVGGGNNPPGGMELDREISLIARYADGGNGTGGWL